MKRTSAFLSVFTLLTILLVSCAPVATPAATSTPPPPPKYQGLAESTTCSVGLILDWDEEAGPDGCVIKDFGGYKTMYYGLSHNGRRAALAVRNNADQFAWIEYVISFENEVVSINATGLTGDVSVTSRLNYTTTSIIETITEFDVASDYVQYNASLCQQGYLISIDPNEGFDFLTPLIKTSEGHIAVESNGGTLSFLAWTQEDGRKPLSTMQYPAEYGNIVQTAFQVGGQWVDARASNCGGGVLGMEYMPR